MWNNLKLRSVLVVAVTALAIWFSYPLFNVYDKSGKLEKEGKIKLGLDLQGGMHMVLQVDTSKLTPEEAKDAPQRALEIIRNRIDQFGVVEPLVQLQGKDRILIQLPGITDRQRAKDIVGKTAHLEFKIASDDTEALKKAIAGEKVPGYELKYAKSRESRSKEPMLLEEKAVLTGDMLVDASMEFSSQGFGLPYVSLEFNDKGAQLFSDITGTNTGKRMAIVLDGEIYTAPVIRERIPSGRAQITGNFSVQEAKDISIVLRAGALPAPVKILEERSVGAALGKDSIEKGMRSVLVGGLLVMLFMAVYYLKLGLIADFAVFVNIILITGFLGMFKGTLSLPGIAGLVLTIGMSVDANVLIFERMREEQNLGKPVRATIAAGYDKAFWTIFDSNLTTLITALILFQFGTGPVKGFATTLSVGIVCSMFTALVLTRLVLDYMTAGESKAGKFNMLHFFGKTNIQFMQFRKFAYIFSFVVILVGLVVFFKRGEGMYGIDFRGGTLQELRFKEAMPVDNIRKVLDTIGVGTAGIQRIGEGKDVIIKSESGKGDAILDGLRKKFGNDSFELLRVEDVGPAVGADLRGQAVKALLWAMIGICIYVAFRFEFRFAVTAVVALFHDVLISLGLLAVTGREISIPVVAAILTVVGYSINDTIVVFDRIREKRKFMRKESDETIFNTAINETLSRTILTSLTVLIVVLALYFLGGEVINDFAFVLLIGVTFGTYSSICVASPLLIDWPGGKKIVAKKR